MNTLVVAIATVLVVSAQGAPQETTSSSNREVTSLDTLQSAQQPAQQGWSYYGSQGYGNYGYQNQQPWSPYGGSWGQSWSAQQPSYSSWYGQQQNSWGSSPQWGYNSGFQSTQPSRPSYNTDEDLTTGSASSSSGATVVSSSLVSNGNQNLDWGNQWNSGWSMGTPSWGKSYTPLQGGCYNRCRPQCGFRPPPPPPPPRPPMPPPPPQPPQFGCRPSCRPTCNTRPTCGMGGSQFVGNTMVCGRPNYNQGGAMGGSYYNPGGNYYNPYNPYGVRSQPQVVAPAAEDNKSDDDSS